MGRAGGGSSGGGHSGGGGHSFGGSRSGGHSFGGSGRAGRSSSSSSGFSGSGYHSHHSSFFGPSYHHSSTYVYGDARSFASNLLWRFLMVAVFCVAFIVYTAMTNNLSTPKSTHERTKLTGTVYNAKSVVLQDDLGYIDSDSKLGNELKSFYDSTGVQPYIYIKDYDADLRTLDQKTEWAQEYYDTYVNDTNGFMFIYFGSADDANNNISDAQKDIGDMSYVVGAAASSVMDDEACEIFWSYIDRYWTSDMSTEDMFGTVFGQTGKSIMVVSKTSSQVIGLLIFGIAGLGIIVVGYMIIKAKFKRDKEKAEETAKILNADIDTLSNDKASDDADIGKYL